MRAHLQIEFDSNFLSFVTILTAYVLTPRESMSKVHPFTFESNLLQHSFGYILYSNQSLLSRISHEIIQRFSIPFPEMRA